MINGDDQEVNNTVNNSNDLIVTDLLGDFGGEEVISNVNTTAQADTSGQKASDKPPPKAATSFFLLDFDDSSNIGNENVAQPIITKQKSVIKAALVLNLMSDVASSDYLDTVADLNENINEEVDENLDDVLLPIQDLPKAGEATLNSGFFFDALIDEKSSLKTTNSTTEIKPSPAKKSELLDLFDTKPEESLLLEPDTIQNNQEDPNRNSFDDFFGIETSVAKPFNDSTDEIEAKSDAPLKPNFILGPVEQKSNPQSVPLKDTGFTSLLELSNSDLQESTNEAPTLTEIQDLDEIEEQESDDLIVQRETQAKVEEFHQEEELLFSIGFQNKPEAESDIQIPEETIKQERHVFDDPIDFFASDDRIQPITLDTANKVASNLIDEVETDESLNQDLNLKLDNNKFENDNENKCDLTKEQDVIEILSKDSPDILKLKTDNNDSIGLIVDSSVVNQNLTIDQTGNLENLVTTKSNNDLKTTPIDDEISLKKINENTNHSENLLGVVISENIPSTGNDSNKIKLKFKDDELKKKEERNDILDKNVSASSVNGMLNIEVEASNNTEETQAVSTHDILAETNQDILKIENSDSNILEKKEDIAILEIAIGNEVRGEKIAEENSTLSEEKPEIIEKQENLDFQEEKSATTEIEKPSKIDSDSEASEDKTSESDVADGACLGKSTMEDDQTDNSNMELDDLKAKVWPVFEHCDVDKTGLISINHLIQLCKEHGQESDGLLSKIDRKGTGMLNFDQFLQGVAALLEPEEANLDEDFEIGKEPERTVSSEPTTLTNISTSQLDNETPTPTEPDQTKTKAGKMTSPSRSPTSPTLSNPTSSPQSLTDSAIGGEYSTSPEFRQVVDFRDEGEEILESFGEKEMDFDSDVPDIGVRPEGGGMGGNGGDLVRRHSWLRTSLRRSSPKQDSLVPPKRWGSFRVPRNRSTTSFASALYQTGNSASFNSSGRSSNCDDGELQDIHSDISIEDDVIDLNNKVHQLQEQVGILAENQQTSDDRYTRVKQENAALTARIHMLEEHIREIEVRSEERIQDELKRSKELLARLEREKELQLENYAIRNSGLEQEVARLKEENVNLKRELERTKDEKRTLETQMVELQREVSRDKEERRALEDQMREERELWQGEQQANNQHIQELSREIEEQRQMVVAARQTDSGHHSVEEADMLAELPARIADMEGQIRILRDTNKRLDEGRKLLSESEANNSLAAEFEAMSENENPQELKSELEKMRKALQEQQDVNRHLRGYIDNVLLNIMEKYPEILEIRAAK